MKHLLTTLLLLVTTLSGSAQTISPDVYVYLHDGNFLAFPRTAIDRISYVAADSTGYAAADSTGYAVADSTHVGTTVNRLSQVFYTADSTYVIPLENIDSISFVRPETVVNSDVFPLKAEHVPYIAAGASTTDFTLLPTTPDNLRPRVGNIVVANDECSAFPDGIIARVVAVSNTGDGFHYECEQAYISDVFDQIVVLYSNKGQAAGAPVRRAGDDDPELLWDKVWEKTIEQSGTKTELNVRDLAYMTVVVRKTWGTPFFFQMQLVNELTSSIHFNAEISASSYFEKQIGETYTGPKIKIPYTLGLLWLQPKLSLFGYFEDKGEVTFDYNAHFDRMDAFTLTYCQGWDSDHQSDTDTGHDVAKLDFTGSAEVGLKPVIDFSLNGRKAGFGVTGKLGLKKTANFQFDALAAADGTLYDAMAESNCLTTLPWSVEVHANANIFEEYDKDDKDDKKDDKKDGKDDGEEENALTKMYSHEFKPDNEPIWGERQYILPFFYGVEGLYPGDDHSRASLKAGAFRNMLAPVDVGFAVLDAEKNIVNKSYYALKYPDMSDFHYYTGAVSGLEAYDGQQLTVRPLVKVFGLELLASPEVVIVDDNTTANLCPDNNHPHLIDLGLPSGTKWACCNIGASYPEDGGGFYAFGETSTKSEYTAWNYEHAVEAGTAMAKFWSWQHPWWTETDKTIAGTQWDAAHVNWGVPYVMPDAAQWTELIDQCSSVWTTIGGMNGRLYTGPSGKAVFIPAAGYYKRDDAYGSYFTDQGVVGHYYVDKPGSTPMYTFSKKITEAVDGRPTSGAASYLGLSVRAVAK